MGCCKRGLILGSRFIPTTFRTTSSSLGGYIQAFSVWFGDDRSNGFGLKGGIVFQRFLSSYLHVWAKTLAPVKAAGLGFRIGGRYLASSLVLIPPIARLLVVEKFLVNITQKVPMLGQTEKERRSEEENVADSYEKRPICSSFLFFLQMIPLKPLIVPSLSI